MEQGFNGVNIDKALKILAEQKDKNLIIWFATYIRMY